MRLPRGSRIYPTNETEQMLGGNTHNWNIVINAAHNAAAIGEAVEMGILRAARSAGIN